MTDLKFPSGFKVEEFTCRCGCKRAEMDQTFLNRLGMLRVSYGMPMIITSAFRCNNYNMKLKNASKNSQHLVGKAVDISVVEAEKRYKLIACAIQVGFSVGIDGAFCHLDSRDGPKLLFLYPAAKDA